MSSVIEELESTTESGVCEMKRWGLQPIDWDVYIDETTKELWVNVWFEEGPLITERRKFGLYLIKSELERRASIVPEYVNVTYEDNTASNGIAVWWTIA
jgi:hypothetical protein